MHFISLTCRTSRLSLACRTRAQNTYISPQLDSILWSLPSVMRDLKAYRQPGKRSQFKIRGIVSTGRVSLLHHHKLEKLYVIRQKSATICSECIEQKLNVYPSEGSTTNDYVLFLSKADFSVPLFSRGFEFYSLEEISRGYRSCPSSSHSSPPAFLFLQLNGFKHIVPSSVFRFPRSRRYFSEEIPDTLTQLPWTSC